MSVPHMQSNHSARIRIKLNGLCIFCHARLFNMALVRLFNYTNEICQPGWIFFSHFTFIAITLKIDIKLPSFLFPPTRRRRLFALQMMEFFISKCVIHFAIPCMSLPTTSSYKHYSMCSITTPLECT